MNIFRKNKKGKEKIEQYERFIEQIEYLASSIESSIHILERATKTTKFERGKLDTYQQIFNFLNAKLKELEGDE